MRCDGVGDATVLADGVNAGAYALRYEGRGELSREVGVEAIDAVGAGAGAAASASLSSSACRCEAEAWGYGLRPLSGERPTWAPGWATWRACGSVALQGPRAPSASRQGTARGPGH